MPKRERRARTGDVRRRPRRPARDRGRGRHRLSLRAVGAARGLPRRRRVLRRLGLPDRPARHARDRADRARCRSPTSGPGAPAGCFPRSRPSRSSCLIAAAISFSNAEIHDLRAQALGTLFYCANWVMIFAKSNYFTSLGRPSPFLHMWTLAVEEQFYVVLPLVLFAARRAVVRHPVRVAAIALVGAVASTVWMGVLVSPTGDPSRAYLGSDSHAMGLLVGVALGVLAGVGRAVGGVHAPGCVRTRPRARRAPLLAAASLVAILVTMRVDRRSHARALPRRLPRVRRAVRGDRRGRRDDARRADRATAAHARGSSRSGSVRIRCTCGTGRCGSSSRPSSGLDGFALFAVRLVDLGRARGGRRSACVERPFRVGEVRAPVPGAGPRSRTSPCSRSSRPCSSRPSPRPSRSRRRASRSSEDPGGNDRRRTTLRVDIFGDSTALVFGLAGADHARELDISVGGDAELGCGVVQDRSRDRRARASGARRICAGWQARWQASLRKDPHGAPRRS